MVSMAIVKVLDFERRLGFGPSSATDEVGEDETLRMGGESVVKGRRKLCRPVSRKRAEGVSCALLLREVVTNSVETKG